jgi:hypothetical protein
MAQRSERLIGCKHFAVAVRGSNWTLPGIDRVANALPPPSGPAYFSPSYHLASPSLLSTLRQVGKHHGDHRADTDPSSLEVDQVSTASLMELTID